MPEKNAVILTSQTDSKFYFHPMCLYKFWFQNSHIQRDTSTVYHINLADKVIGDCPNFRIWQVIFGKLLTKLPNLSPSQMFHAIQYIPQPFVHVLYIFTSMKSQLWWCPGMTHTVKLAVKETSSEIVEHRWIEAIRPFHWRKKSVNVKR